MRMRVRHSETEESLIGAFSARISRVVAMRRAEAAVRAARAEADLSIKARSQFLENMNHELRTPLNAIIGFATMLKDESAYNLTADKRGEYATYVVQSADLLLGHINTILEIAALDGGSVDVRQDNVSLFEELKAAVDRARVAAEMADVEIDVHGEGEDAPAWADSQRVAQALDHLVRLAVKRSAPGSRILVRASVDDRGWSEIAIRDRGEGLTAEELDASLRIFDNARLGLNGSFDGPSIDLAIAKSFVELQGGEFFVKSSPAKGTLVRIVFPPDSEDAVDVPLADHGDDIRLAG
ncbi:MAG: HAMP domain-containing sensor histidine kinase [Pseudomonadota bacterium]